MRVLVIFDDDCSFCTACVRLARRLDWLRRLDYLPASNTAATARYGLTREDTDYELKAVADRRIYGGYDAVTEIAARLPVLAVFAPFMRLGFVRRIGQKLYRRVAERRTCAYRPVVP